MNRIFSLLLVTLAIPAGNLAQTPSYMHYDMSDGLPSNMIYCATIAQNGMLWLGTDKGLVSFDGEAFQVLDMDQGLPDPEVLYLQTSSKSNRIWISCFRQQLAYWEAGEISTIADRAMVNNSQTMTNVRFILERDTQISTFAGRYYIKLEPSGTYSYLMPDVGGRIWMQNGITYVFGTASIMIHSADTVFQRIFDFGGGLGTQNTYKGMNQIGNIILYSFQDRLVLLKFNEGTFKVVQTIPGLSGQVFTDSQGFFWVCTGTGAVCLQYTDNGLQFIDRILPDLGINSMTEDLQGNLWFCTAGYGLYMLPPKAPVTFLESSQVLRLAPGMGNEIICGTNKGELFATQKGLFQPVASLSENKADRIVSIRKDRHQRLWVATDRELSSIDANGKKQYSLLYNGAFKDLLLLNDSVYFASSSGIGLIDKRLHRLKLFSQRATCIEADADANIWAGTTEGIISAADGFSGNWGNHFPLLKGRIIDITAASGNILWVSTPENGLIQVQVQAKQIIRTRKVNDVLDSPIQNIQKIVVDPSRAHRLWLATNNGVYCVENERILYHYNRNNGLASNDVSDVHIEGDTLWAATTKGVTRLLVSQQSIPLDYKVLITGLKYISGNQEQSQNLIGLDRPLIELEPGAKNISISASSLNYRLPGSTQYQFQIRERLLPFFSLTLHNVWAGWIAPLFHAEDAALQKGGPLLNLGLNTPPGCYHIQVKTFVNGAPGKGSATLILMIQPAWHQTLWFWLFIWGCILAFVYRIIRTYTQLQRMKTEVSEMQLQALQARINPHFIGNSINAIQQFFFPPNPAKASEYISLFHRLLQRTIIFSEKHLIPFEEEVRYDADFLKMIQLRIGSGFEFRLSGEQNIPPHTLFPTLILQPILENATLHGLSPEGHSVLHVHFSADEERYFCTITDNGAGINTVRFQRKMSNPDHKSKGIELITRKIQTLNILYQQDFKLTIQDVSETDPLATGTRVTLSFKK